MLLIFRRQQTQCEKQERKEQENGEEDEKQLNFLLWQNSFYEKLYICYVLEKLAFDKIK